MHLLLAADGVLYFILALVDLLSHVAPAARNSATASNAVELFLGSVSFVPMLSYTSYLVWLSRREFITYLPHRHQPVVRYLLTGAVPVIVAINFAASLGISIRNLSLSHAQIMIDFNNKSESVWLSLGQLSLGTYTTFQCFTAFLALYRLFLAFFDQQRIDIKQSDERHFFNGTGWITVGIKLGAIESIVGFTSGGLAVPLSRRLLRLIGRLCIIIGSLKGMDENENFELLNKELVLWRRGKPVSNSHSLIANRRMSIRTSQFSDLSRESSIIEKDVERGKKDRRVTAHDEGGEAPILHIRLSALSTPKQVMHADDSRRQSGRNTSAEALASRIVARLSKSNTQRQSAKPIFDDMSFVLDLTPNSPPGVTDKYPGSKLGQGYEDHKKGLPVVGIPRQPTMRHDTAQPSGDEDGASETVITYASDFVERKPIPPPVSIPQPALARTEGPTSPWTKLAPQQSGNYPVQFPVAPTRAGVTIYSPTAQMDGESWDTPQQRQRQLSSLHLFDRASQVHDDTVHSSQWSTIARSQSPASVRIHNGGTVISPGYTFACPDDVMSRSSEETLRDDQHGFTGPAGPRIQTAFNREQALRRLNGEVGP